jgi:hypothetical protein
MKKNKENYRKSEDGMNLEASMGGITGNRMGGGRKLTTKASSLTRTPDTVRVLMMLKHVRKNNLNIYDVSL